MNIQSNVLFKHSLAFLRKSRWLIISSLRVCLRQINCIFCKRKNDTSSNFLHHLNLMTPSPSFLFRHLFIASPFCYTFCLTDSFELEMRRDNRHSYPIHCKSVSSAQSFLALWLSARAWSMRPFKIFPDCWIRTVWVIDLA